MAARIMGEATRNAPDAEESAALSHRVGAVSRRWRNVLAKRSQATRAAESTDIDDALVARGVESIYEGYALHYAQSSLIDAAAPESLQLLIGDYCYAAGLCDVARAGDLASVEALATLIADVSATNVDRDKAWQRTIAALNSADDSSTNAPEASPRPEDS